MNRLKIIIMKKLAQALQFISIAFGGRLGLLTAVQKQIRKNSRYTQQEAAYKQGMPKASKYSKALEDVQNSRRKKTIGEELDDMLNDSKERLDNERFFHDVTGRNSITINNGTVIIDGKVVSESNARNIHITLVGDVAILKVGACSTLTIEGNAGAVVNTSGNIKIAQNVEGDVQTTSGNITITGSCLGNPTTKSGNIVIKK